MQWTNLENDEACACAPRAARQAACARQVVVAVTHQFGKIILVNDLFCQISGRSRVQPSGRNHRIPRIGQHSLELSAPASGPPGAVACWWISWARVDARRGMIAPMGILPPALKQQRFGTAPPAREVMPADRQARRRASWIVLAGLVAGLAVIVAELQQLELLAAALAAGDPAAPGRAVAICRSLLWATLALLALGAFACVRSAVAIRRCGQYPLPGSRPLRDTIVRRGRHAQRIATVGFVVAGLLVATGVALFNTVQGLLATFTGPALP
jgi:hypothetical protein